MTEVVKVHYLRISVTDRCDLRCLYCMPMRSTGAPKSDVLTYEEIVEVVRLLVPLGISKVRLTGGEPLRRPGVEWLIREVAKVPGVLDLGLTTNGTRLSDFIGVLRESRFRVNVHLDTLDPQRYRGRMGGRDPKVVCDAIEEAIRAGVKVKINSVVSEGVAIEDIFGVIEFGRKVGAPVRLIEAMPVSGLQDPKMDGRLMASIERAVVAAFDMEPYGMDGVARMFRGKGGEEVGFITPSHPRFCDGCNKLRLSARGRLKTCLFGKGGMDLKAYLRSGDREGLVALVKAAISQKSGRESPCIETMSGIGG